MKKALLVLIACLFMFIGAPGTAQAEWHPTVKIDGALRTFNPPCQIVDGRTMIPLRFVVEDEALQGNVSWDGSSQKVTVSCRGKNFEFQIGSPTVLINGTSVTMDVSPYIYQDRTYLPLRFLAENLGGTVTWNDALGQVNIYFNKSAQTQPAVFAYYYSGGFPELKANASLFSDVALRWFETDADGDLYYEYQDNYQQVLNFLDQNGIKKHASVVCMDADQLHTLLSNPSNRANLINQLCSQVKNSNYDGVNIDFEFLAARDSDNYTTFLRELKSRLGADKELSVAVMARTSSDTWANAYDYQAIGTIADRIVVMTYDYCYPTSDAGPVAPLWWVNDVVDYMLGTAQIPPSKLLLGVATYGYNWGSGQKGTTVTLDKLNQLENTYNVKAHFDTDSMSPYYTYTDNNGVYHEIWLENERSLEEKWKVVVNDNLGGISFWRIGNGFTDLYNLLEEHQGGN